MNSLAALNFEEVFGERSIYQLAPARERPDGEGVPLHLRGYFLFDASASYATLSSRFARGADVKTTNITEEFDYEAFMATYPDAIPLFLIGPGDAVTVVTVRDPPQPKAGQRLMAVVRV